MVSSQMVNNPSVQQNLPALRLADFYSWTLASIGADI